MKTLTQLIDQGQSYWLDNLTREMIASGELERRVNSDGLRGVTSNPAIFYRAISGGPDYDTQISEAVEQQSDMQLIYQQLVTRDIRDACDILRPVYDDSAGEDGFVSLEVSPHLAHDTAASIDEAQRLWQIIDRPNLMIKIPATRESLPAIGELLFQGLNINITLLFSIQTYRAVAETYMLALEHRLEHGRNIDHIASVASFFLSRIDTLVDTLLCHRSSPSTSGQTAGAQNLLGKAALASAKLAFGFFDELQQSQRWQALLQQGARPQRLLWASTSTKNPDYSDIKYVQSLIGPNTVNTMTVETINAFADHGKVQAKLQQDMEQAREIMQQLNSIGIDMNFVTQQLLNEGIQKFIEPYDDTQEVINNKCLHYLSHQHAEPLLNLAQKLRRQVIRMTTEAGSGHATSCMSCADIISALFFHEMRWDPVQPQARDVDSFVLSKGHAAPILWAALFEAGAISENPLSLRRIDSSLEGHPTTVNPWVKVATGSLGQGLSAANGIAVANKMDGIAARVFCLLGDGECAEGSIWEAAQFASLQRLDSVVAIVDVNGLGQSGPTPYRHDTSVYARRFQAFGWNTIEIDGHDMRAILDALIEARDDGPTAILARTVKGKGVSFLEFREDFHGKALDNEHMQMALKELGEREVTIAVKPRHLGIQASPGEFRDASISVTHQLGDLIATRAAFGNALKKLGDINPFIVVLDGDVKNSTYTEDFANAFPQRFFESFIAEQNMVGMALGLAASGKVPYVATFACFLSRAYDFIRMAGHTHPEHLVFCGSHAGVSIGEDGSSQMGLEDMAMFRSMHRSTVFYPCDGVSTERITELAGKINGIVYIRTTRPKTSVLYDANELFTAGGSKLLRVSSYDQFTIVAVGITVYEALAAYDMLQQDGIPVRVVDAYSVKPLDTQTLNTAAIETRAILTVEDHWIDGGLGDAVAAHVSRVPVIRLGINEEPHSGTREELMHIYGISRDAIYNQVHTLASQLGERTA